MKHVIIGAGAAGITAAKTIRALEPSAEILIISKDKFVHSRCMLHKYISGERNEESLNFVEPEFFDRNRILWRASAEVKSIATAQKNVILSDGQRIAYDKLLIATGADSFIPPVGDFRTAANVFGLRNLEDAQKIAHFVKPKGRAVIVGSGLVGMDAAYGLLEKNMDVTVVEMADRILPLQLDENAGNEYRKLFEKAGCRFILGKKASETVLDNFGNVCKLILDDKTVLDCDVVIVAAGVRPSVALCADSGIPSDKSIVVNEYMETGVKGIYAAGDVAGLSGIWPNAMKQGMTAAHNMCGRKLAYDDTYAMKNTINFFGLMTLSLGRGQIQEGDKVVIKEDSKSYKRAIIRNHKLDSILLQGNIDYAGAYQYLIKHQVVLNEEKDVFKTSFADYYQVKSDGQYEFNMNAEK